MPMSMERSLKAIQDTPVLMQALLRGVDEAQARAARDGDGWNVTEVLCHLHDYDGIFRVRMESSARENEPTWVGYNPDQLAAEHHYADQAFAPTLAAFLERRREIVAFLKGLPAADYEERAGVHATLGRMTLTDQVVLMALHDVNHMEQIVRALGING